MLKYFNVVELECPICGKNFIPAPNHVYNDGADNAVCSYTCHLEAFRSKGVRKKKKQRKRIPIVPGRDDEIRRLASEGVSYEEIGKKFGLGIQRIYQIIRNK